MPTNMLKILLSDLDGLNSETINYILDGEQLMVLLMI